jgi:hypothetical protein
MALNGFNLDAAARDDVSFMLWNAGAEAPGSVFPAAVAGWSNAGRPRLPARGIRDARPRSSAVPAGEEGISRKRSRRLPLPGVKIHVLGPPRDPELIEELDPEADGETYRALALRAGGGRRCGCGGAARAVRRRMAREGRGARIPARRGRDRALKVLARGADALAGGA